MTDPRSVTGSNDQSNKPHNSAWSNAPAAAAAGVASAVLAAGAGELAAAAMAPVSSPFATVGGALIDLAPAWAKDAAIALFGTNDKTALLTGIGVVLVGVAAAAGILEQRWPPAGRGIFVVLAATGIVAATTRTDAVELAWLPATVAGLVAVLILPALMRRVPTRIRPQTSERPEEQPGPSRRSFVAWTGAATLVGLLAAAGGTLMQAAPRAANAARKALRLPAATTPAAPPPAGAALHIPGLASLVTPADAFYRVDTAIFVPEVDPAGWSLRIHGLVEHEITLRWEELLALPLEESYTTLACVSNPVGGDLIDTAKWLGYPIRHLLARAVPRADADMVLSRSADGFTASTPLSVLTDQRHAILAVGMNGHPLPAVHGFPVRMVVPGLYGYVSATKWVVDLEVTRFDRAAAYWTDRGWAARGPVKLESRIDVPRVGRTVPAGRTVIAGVAWQQHVGVSRVEVAIDDGAWQEATLAPAISADTWVQWSLPWTARAGDHRIRCRATSAAGQVQTAREAPTVPDGATGWHTVDVHVG